MKKILYVITKGNWGGAQRYVYDLATTLPHDQFEVAVAYGQPGLLADRLHAAGITTHELPLQRDVSALHDLQSFSALYTLCKNIQPDTVHLNSSKAGGIGALAANLAGVKNIVFTIHGLPEDEARNPLTRMFIWLMTRLTVMLCDKVITVSKDNQRRIGKSTLIYNGIAPIEFGDGSIIRNAFPAGVTITGTIGELTHNKNQIALIEEARTKPDMYVAIVGEGELRKTLEQKITEYKLEDRVKLFGFIPAAEAMRGFDVFALPSKKEGLPYVLLEAKQAGLPIVANRVGGVGEILDTDLREFTLEQMVEKTVALY